MNNDTSEAIKSLRAAGGNGWDSVNNVQKELKELRGEPVESLWEPVFVNDAVIVRWAGNDSIFRVVAITNDGLRVVKPCGDIVFVEPRKGCWRSCGHFIEVPRFFLFWKQGSDWQFVPNEGW
jgi:hypothetical protein